MKKILVFILIFALSMSLVSSHGEETFSEAENIIKSKVPCEQLTDDKLEMLGDYYMEQMHPEEDHEAMDEMMGGEGSESLRQMHINMARNFYCGEHGVMSSGMMNIMMGRGRMMDYFSLKNQGGMINMAGYGMMGSSGMFIGGFLWLIYLAIGTFVISVIFWSTYKWIVKDKKR